MIEKLLEGIRENRSKFPFVSVLLIRGTETLTVDSVDDPVEQRLKLDAAIKQGWEPIGFMAISLKCRAVAWPLDINNHAAGEILEANRKGLEVQLFGVMSETIYYMERLAMYAGSGRFLIVALAVAFPESNLLVHSAQPTAERLDTLNEAIMKGGRPMGYIGICAHPGEDRKPKFELWPVVDFFGNQGVIDWLDSLRDSVADALSKSGLST